MMREPHLTSGLGLLWSLPSAPWSSVLCVLSTADVNSMKHERHQYATLMTGLRVPGQITYCPNGILHYLHFRIKTVAH